MHYATPKSRLWDSRGRNTCRKPDRDEKEQNFCVGNMRYSAFTWSLNNRNNEFPTGEN